MNLTVSLMHVGIALVCAPFLRSVINKTKAFFAGKQGPSWFQPYYDLRKLVSKGAVYSHTTGWLFRAGPVAALGSTLAALMIMPAAAVPGLIHFQGDLILFVYILGIGRFFTICAALDTGSSFEGMGASREAFYSALAEPALLVALGSLALLTRSLSLSTVYLKLSELQLGSGAVLPAFLFLFLAFYIVFLAENSRIPVDDPTTHLELTMIHEVMILDHSGPDLAMIEYAGALKLWVLGLMMAGLFASPFAVSPLISLGISAAALVLIGVLVGITESVTARFSLPRVPRFLAVSFVLAVLGLLWIMR